MVDKAHRHPYANTIGGLSKTLLQFRNSFPPAVDAKTLQKLSIAPNNESYVINVLQFLNLIDADGKKTNAAGEIFSQHEDVDFAQAFAARVEVAYSGLFELRGEESWGLDKD